MAVRTAVSISTRAYRHVSSILLLLLLPHLLSKKCFLLSTNWIQPSRSRSGSSSIAAEKSSSVFDIQVSARLVVLQNIWCLLLFRFTADLRKLFPPLGDHGNMTPNSHLINSWKVFLWSYGDQSRYSTDHTVISFGKFYARRKRWLTGERRLAASARDYDVSAEPEMPFST